MVQAKFHRHTASTCSIDSGQTASLNLGSHALEALSKDDELVIKKADKGGTTVVWGKGMYITEAHGQLNNNFYHLTYNLSPQNGTKGDVHHAKERGWIPGAELKFLYNENPCVASFYMLLKIHKCVVNSPGRPVISGNDSLTKPVSKYIDHFIKPF